MKAAYPTTTDAQIRQGYELARERYAALGVDVDAALKALAGKAVSMHCWQGDDVVGFEVNEKGLTGGIMATGNHPGKARTPEELRADAEQAMKLIPGTLRFNLHALYLESGGTFVDRDQVGLEHFRGWIDWAKAKGVGLDFNPSFFSHPKSASGMTLSHPDKGIRDFWIEHGRRSREIAAGMAAALGDTVVNSFWIPDGMKDFPADRWSPRRRLVEAYDAIFATPGDARVKDAVEGKLFGLGSEEYVVGSAEFYLAYALSRKKLLCLDMGHYHPTETIHDKLSAVLTFLPEALIHVSRPVRWDSDHVVIMNEDLLNLAREMVRGDALGRVYLATDFFDASINRIGAWTIGIRSLQKALLYASLEPVGTLRRLEAEGRGAEKLALAEECRSLPHGAVWDHYCLSQGVPVGSAWLNDLVAYEKKTLAQRG
jgi:L-rhamnose isomerase